MKFNTTPGMSSFGLANDSQWGLSGRFPTLGASADNSKGKCEALK